MFPPAEDDTEMEKQSMVGTADCSRFTPTPLPPKNLVFAQYSERLEVPEALLIYVSHTSCAIVAEKFQRLELGQRKYYSYCLPVPRG